MIMSKSFKVRLLNALDDNIYFRKRKKFYLTE
jgi:hypothetical protein